MRGCFPVDLSKPYSAYGFVSVTDGYVTRTVEIDNILVRTRGKCTSYIYWSHAFETRRYRIDNNVKNMSQGIVTLPNYYYSFFFPFPMPEIEWVTLVLNY